MTSFYLRPDNMLQDLLKYMESCGDSVVRLEVNVPANKLARVCEAIASQFGVFVVEESQEYTEGFNKSIIFRAAVGGAPDE